MKTAVILYDGFSVLEFSALYEPLARAASEKPSAGLQVDACARSSEVFDAQGLHFYPTRQTGSLHEYDLIAVPGGPGAARWSQDAQMLAWLTTARPGAQIVSVGSGALLLAAAGLLAEHAAAASPGLAEPLAAYGIRTRDLPLVFDGPLLSAADARSALDLGLALANSLTGGPPLRPISGAAEDAAHLTAPLPRRAHLERKTGETEVKLSLNLDGGGKHQIDTGLPFLDHMLTQVAVHGLFDLEIKASGDLHVDAHHTLEDVALTLGSAFQQALGDRAGITRMASVEVPMDESLAAVAFDFSGRPYAVLQTAWTLPEVGGLANTLFEHFIESFAQTARCNLHARILYGRDDHHKAEALFKAFGRAACAATRLDPRRGRQIPSSKGMLV
jgi:imidazoleglycerol-phosphate dehydratase